jgi:DNA-binding CsgD family transcriptional regulator
VPGTGTGFRAGAAGLPASPWQAWTLGERAGQTTPPARPQSHAHSERPAPGDVAQPELHALRREIDALRARVQVTEAALDHVRCALLVVDEHATIHFANHAARRLLAEGDALQSQGGVLAARINGDAAALAALIARTAGRSGPGCGPARSVSMAIRRGLARPPLIAVTVPARPGSRWSSPIACHVLLHVVDPGERSGASTDALRDAFGLTERETSVVRALLRLGSLPAAAGEMGIALTTARSHLQHVFDKTGARNQVALAQMLAALAALPSAWSSAVTPVPPPAHQRAALCRDRAGAAA